MPLAPVVSTSLTTPTTFTGLGVRVGGSLLTDSIYWPTFAIVDDGDAGDIRFVLKNSGLADWPNVYDQALIEVINFDDNDAREWAGHVQSRKPVTIPGPYDSVEVKGWGIGSLLDDIYIVFDNRPEETAKVRASFLWGKYAGSALSPDLSNIESFGGTLDPMKLVSLTMRQALEATIAQASSRGDLRVDPMGALHIFRDNPSNAAPFDINADSPGAGEIAPQDLEIDYDGGEYANSVYVQGFNRAGSGRFFDHGAIAAANGLVRTATLQAPECRNRAQALNLATMYLGRTAANRPRGTFTTTGNDGWMSGQLLLVTSAAHGLDEEEFRIRRVTTTLARPGTDWVRQYRVEFGV